MEKQGYEVQQRVRINHKESSHLEFDLVGFRLHNGIEEIVSVEVKKTQIIHGIKQTILRTLFCDRCYLAVPIEILNSKTMNNHSILLDHCGIGVLAYTQNSVDEFKYARTTTDYNNHLRQILLTQLKDIKPFFGRNLGQRGMEILKLLLKNDKMYQAQIVREITPSQNKSH